MRENPEGMEAGGGNPRPPAPGIGLTAAPPEGKQRSFHSLPEDAAVRTVGVRTVVVAGLGAAASRVDAPYAGGCGKGRPGNGFWGFRVNRRWPNKAKRVSIKAIAGLFEEAPSEAGVLFNGSGRCPYP